MSQPARAMSHPVPEQPISYASKYKNLVRKLKGLPPEAPVSITHKPVPMRPKAKNKPLRDATSKETDSLILALRKKKKTQLYDRAKEIGLDGRSNMNKEQLVLALAAHERKQQQRSTGRTTLTGNAAAETPASEPAEQPLAKPAAPQPGSAWSLRREGSAWLGKPLSKD